MKKTFWALALVLLLSATKSFGQDTIPSVEKSIKGVQIGDSGLIFNYEFKLSNKIALRTEAGYTLAFYSGDDSFFRDEKGSTVGLPTFTVEPRWYYNLNRRVRKGKDISRNGANYFSLFTNYSGGWGAIKFDNRLDDVPDFITITPMWGMRRTLGQHFNYELGAGIGYGYVSEFKHFDHTHKADNIATIIVRARFGFDF